MIRKYLTSIVPLIATLIIISFYKNYNYHQIFPKNDLWKQDCLTKDSSREEMFNNVIDAAYEIYLPIAEKFGDKKLVINRKWDDPTVNANCSRLWGKVTINMYGGLARRPEINAEGFALVLCHELSHAYGGKPYISSWRKLSAEGQADYMGAKFCLHRILKKLNLEDDLESSDYIKEVCLNSFNTSERSVLCEQSLIGGISLGKLLATLTNQKIPQYETPDPTIVDSTLTSYPDTIQCRLDTYLKGSLQQERPLCWYHPSK